MSTERVVATILGLAYIEFMSEILKMEAQGVKITPMCISKVYRHSILKAADQFGASKEQQERNHDAVMAFAFTMKEMEKLNKTQDINDLINQTLKKESEG